MAKALAIFNIIAGGCSIAGLILATQIERPNYLIAGVLIASLALSFYVLFFPANKILMNVESKIRYFKNSSTGETSEVQRGEFVISGGGPTRIEFNQPYATPPSFEVVHAPGKSGALPNIKDVSELGASIYFHSYSTGLSKRFIWIAHGEPLSPLTHQGDA